MQLDGVDRRGRRDDVDVRTGQGDRDVDADPRVLLHGLRALGREHVPVPVRPDARRPLHGRRLSAVERDPDGTRQPGRLAGVRRRGAVQHALQDRTETRVRFAGGCRRAQGLIALRKPQPTAGEALKLAPGARDRHVGGCAGVDLRRDHGHVDARCRAWGRLGARHDRKRPSPVFG
ncbi:hypothetical protein F01_560014 [Burkholderia cenocepacia]|nr:hypothetical protein F01_560014 [Burkholderia cenocepacia]